MTTATAAPLAPQLALLKQELLDARERTRRLVKGLGEEAWTRRPDPGTWSVGECITHLNITSERSIPLLDEAIRDGRARGLESSGPYRRGLIGWALLRFLEPPYKFKTRTASAFVPGQVEPMHEVLERFDYLQQELQVRVDRAAGLALDKLKVISPFDARVKYNVYAFFAIIAAHQRRHLWQAEQIPRM